MAIAAFKSCIEKLNLNNQFLFQFAVSKDLIQAALSPSQTWYHFIVFQSLTSAAESKLVEDFRLTKFAAGLYKERNRYKNILPCKSAFYTVTFSKKKFGLQKIPSFFRRSAVGSPWTRMASCDGRSGTWARCKLIAFHMLNAWEIGAPYAHLNGDEIPSILQRGVS